MVDGKRTSKKGKKLPSFSVITLKVWQEISTFWRPIFAVTAVYAICYFVFIVGLSFSFNYTDIRDIVNDALGSETNPILANIVSATYLLAVSASGESGSSALFQFTLFIVASMAMIWTLRKIRALKKIRIKHAYFDGTARLVPFSIVLFVLMLTLIPMALGSVVYSTAQSFGATGLELIMTGLVSAILAVVTIYWFASWFPALYIVSLPDGTPIQAIKSAHKITKQKKFWLMRQIIFSLFATVITAIIFVLMFSLVVPMIAAIVAYLVVFVMFAVLHIFGYTIYRSLLDES